MSKLVEEKTENEKSIEKLFQKRKSAWLQLKDSKEAFEFSEGYKKFVSDSKTERLCVENIRKFIEDKGFKDIKHFESISEGDKVYRIIKDKCLIAAKVGEESDCIKIIGSHIDSPRLDLKPSPLYEDSDVALLQTHYYGGIKKYHWVNVPLALHGVIHTKTGEKIHVKIGEEDDEPKFIIPDLLIHLSKEQMKKEGSKVIEGEELNVFFGNYPVNDEKINEKVKFNILKKINNEYGLVEEDFNFAELQFVPANKAQDVGFDRSMISAYGHDDRSAAYASLLAFSESKPKRTSIIMFVDKEEIGSTGNTGAESFVLKDFVDDCCRLLGIKKNLLRKAEAISAEVTAAIDPTHKSVTDAENASYLGGGVSINKYGGSGGKYNANDTHAEYMQKLRSILVKNEIPWQISEFGKIDAGGGGTISAFLSRYGMDCVDAGPCILGMHSTCELMSKADLYCSYLFYKAFFEND